MHKCPNCGKEYEGKFCPECGAKRQEETTCPQCGTKLEGTAKFCSECGYSFSRPEQKQKKPSVFKQKVTAVLSWLKTHLKVIIPTAAAIAVIITVTCVCVSVTSNVFRVGKVSKIEIGYTQEQVLKVLGEPYADTKEDYKWEYYDGKYTEVLDKIAANDKAQEKAVLGNDEGKLLKLMEEELKLEEQLESMTFKFIEVNFSLEQTGDNEKAYTVSSIIFDNARCDGNENCKKELKQINLSKESAYFFENLSNLNLNCKYYYKDGSYKYSALNRKVVSEIVDGKQNITWEDEWGAYSYSSSFTVKNEISGKTKDLKWKLTLQDTGRFNFEYEYGDWNHSGGGSGSFGGSFISYLNEYDNAYYLGIDGNPYLILCCAKKEITSCKVNEKCSVILRSAFKECRNLTDIDISSGVTCIGGEAFRDCSNLTQITIPNGVKYIGSDTFYGCSGLESAVIPVSVTKIESRAFGFCGTIEFIYEGTVEQWNMIDITRSSNSNSDWAYSSRYTIHCTDGDIDK